MLWGTNLTDYPDRAMHPLLLSLVLATLPGAPPAAPDTADPAPLVITHATVIACTGAARQPDRTVVVQGGKITAIEPDDKATPPAGARTLDGTGKFLIPGLWDMHVHTVPGNYLDLFLANGVVGVRDMHSFNPAFILGLRDEVRAGKRIGPRIVAACALVDGDRAFWPAAIKATTPEEGRQAVRKLKAQRADFIKVYESLSADTFRAIVDECRKQGLPFAGHVPRRVRAADAAEAGMKSIEHFTGLFIACSAQEDEQMKEADAVLSGTGQNTWELLTRVEVKALDAFDPKRAAALYACYARNHTFQVPTLVVLRSLSSLNDAKITSDPRLEYVPPFIRSGWTPETFVKRGTNKPEVQALRKRLYQKGLEQIPAMCKAGVEFLAGTDVTNPFTYAGFSLHDELGLLVEAGLTPLEALQTATRNPARYLGEEAAQGTVEIGKRADLVLLDADPLRDIANTRKIRAVILGGRVLDRDRLDRMLADARPTKTETQPKK
jgi:imidazolonepropionase-like amidohydrolase